MIKKLGQKRRIKESDWREVVSHIEDFITFEEVKEREFIAITRIKEYVNRFGVEHLGYGWSGGKDSLVLSELCIKAKVTQGVFGTCDLEYPVFSKWVEENKPIGVKAVSSGKNIDWLSKHQEMIFPKDSNTMSKWFSVTHRVSQKKYYSEQALSGLILGRRNADGNRTGNGEVIDKNGRVWLSPIYDWEHEVLLGYIYYYKLKMPPIYEWKNGYREGTHLWAMRSRVEHGRIKAEHEMWQEVYDIDNDLVHEVSKVIEGARLFLSEGFR